MYVSRQVHEMWRAWHGHRSMLLAPVSDNDRFGCSA